jgi:hypothetical protein
MNNIFITVFLLPFRRFNKGQHPVSMIQNVVFLVFIYTGHLNPKKEVYNEPNHITIMLSYILHYHVLGDVNFV